MISLSLQSISSLAYKYNLNAQETAERLASFFISLGCHKIYDINLARHLALVESHKEFVSRRDSEKPNLPIISSTCPGWICYAEKTNGELVIQHLSKVRSPQQIMGSLLKRSAIRRNEDIYHVSIMPCFDKKLEASRNDFKNASDGTQDVDCVLTPVELEEILKDEGVELSDFEPRKLDVFFETGTELDTPLSSHIGSESGGLAENILLAEARRNNLDKTNAGDVEYSILRNKDFIELNYRGPSDDLTSVKPGKFAIINGFRNIQTIVQRLKRNALKYDYIEVMACPSGCINGGAQCKPNFGHDQQSATDLVKSIYHQVKPVELSIDPNSREIQNIYQKLELEPKEIEKSLYTEFHPIPKMNNLTVNW